MNQCMGCQANWPVHRRGGHGARPQQVGLEGYYYVHKVVDGYPGEIVRCTADRYQEDS